MMDFRVRWATRLLAAAALTFALGAAEARASIIFSLSGVTFDDGTSATGSFTASNDLKTLLDYHITTQDGTNVSGFDYTPASSTNSSTSLPFILVLNVAPERVIELTFDGLTAAGAPIKI